MEHKLETIVSLAKRRGFIFPGSEIYGGLSGTWDYGPLGAALKNNIRDLWWKKFVLDREDIYGMDAAILMNQKVWQATGHVEGFSDPLVEDLKTHKRYRADQLLEDNNILRKQFGNAFPDEKDNVKLLSDVIKHHNLLSPEGNPLGEVRQFNMLFKTSVGPVADENAISYLRPETAQGMFVNFKNVIDAFHPKLPFGLAQVGKAFRNEIAPRDFTFRSREFEQMEIEYFVRPEEWGVHFERFRKEVLDYISEIGIDKESVHELEVPDEERAFYSKRTIDFEFDYPFGRKELYGLAYRGDFDLSAHAKTSGQSLKYAGEAGKEPFFPHVIEPSFGVDRTILAIFSSAYREDEMDGEQRVYLKLKPTIAPVKVAVFPLLKNKPTLVAKAREIYVALKKEIPQIMFDDNGNIGKRYRRQDEIGTPWCVTIDYQTLEDNTVTVRDRDTGKQERHTIAELDGYFHNMLI